MNKRLDFIAWCLKQLGKPYLWGQKGPDAFDCSGFVTAGYFEVGLPDWRQTHSSANLWDELDDVPLVLGELQSFPQPKPGDLAFWGDPVNHVMVHWGDGRLIGACGGDHTTTTVELALKRNAKVRYRNGVNYRPTFRGYRVSPFEDFETDVPTEGAST